MRGGFGGRGGRGGQGRGGNPWKNMVNKFMEKLGVEMPNGAEEAMNKA
jgi:hypothetical protein